MSIFTKKVNQQKSEAAAKPWTDIADFFMNIADHKRLTKEIILHKFSKKAPALQGAEMNCC